MEAARNGVGSGKPGGRIWVGDNELLDAENTRGNTTRTRDKTSKLPGHTVAAQQWH